MSGTSRTTIRTVVAGVAVNATINREDEMESIFQHPMPAAIAGTLSTRTDANTGILTVPSGHGITADDTVAVFWAGGSRFDVDVTAVTSTTISIDLGDGADLPVVTTPIVVGKESVHALPITGNQLAAFAIGCDNRVSINFRDVSNASQLRYDIAAKEGRSWIIGTDVTNPLAGDVVTSIVVANGGTSAAPISMGLLVSTI
jgi:hypothetical protein